MLVKAFRHTGHYCDRKISNNGIVAFHDSVKDEII